MGQAYCRCPSVVDNSLNDSGPSYKTLASGPLRVSLGTGEQLILDVKRSLHNGRTSRIIITSKAILQLGNRGH